ncbi:MAG: tRNA (guanosine(37)-N1)-methyltransferase TrmD [Planctomycetota bacterium]|jgi:tRNA (guanine37-N1)-methyltransferase
MLRIDILTLFPEVFEPVLGSSITARARVSGLVEWHTANIRDFADNKHNKVDDRPFGGGPGMVMMCQPLWDCVQHVEAESEVPARRILLSPQGRPLTQELVRELAQLPRLLMICGHYEGIDERVVEKLDPIEVSVGDFVLSGGEIPALALIDAVVRTLPGALGHDDSASQDSFEITDETGRPLLDCPHFTRPREWMGVEVPEVLVSGDHAAVDAWRLERSRERTRVRRPDLLGPDNGGEAGN